MPSSKLRVALSKATVWAQVKHPVATSKLMRKLTSSSSRSSKNSSAQAERGSTEKIVGIAEANKAARVPEYPPLERTTGVLAANRAARIPGWFEP